MFVAATRAARSRAASGGTVTGTGGQAAVNALRRRLLHACNVQARASDNGGIRMHVAAAAAAVACPHAPVSRPTAWSLQHASCFSSVPDDGGGSDDASPPEPTDSHDGDDGDDADGAGVPSDGADANDNATADGRAPPTHAPESELEQSLRPLEVVNYLDSHIVGQSDAKRAVAIAMRNRWRRRQLPKDLMKEVTPRNVLMIGPTGCGKTEVARRMATLSEAPFIKVEATKFTEVGYHGRDVDQIVRDLMDVSMTLTRKKQTDKMREEAKGLVEERILDLLTGPASGAAAGAGGDAAAGGGAGAATNSSRETFRTMLRGGQLDEQNVEVDVPVSHGEKGGGAGGEIVFGGDASNPNIAAMNEVISKLTAGGGPGAKRVPTERKTLPVSEARDVILDIELERLLENVDLKKEAIAAVEESGIVFMDEIDKICSSKDYMSKSADASAEGVQRDLLPLVEGTTISTKYGNVNTDYILFIASGAFHAVKPSDMLPELQGRLPIRVELNGLTEDDLYKILTEPVANLLRQQTELLATEGVSLKFEDDAAREIARMAALLNRTVENIGARRLHTVIERIMETMSFEAAEMDDGSELVVDKALVKERLSEVMVSSDLSRYIL